MATEAYVKQHKMERTIEDMLNSLKSQPGNPYTAMAKYLADAKLGGKAPAPAAKKPAAAAAAPEEGAADPAFASTEKMLTPSKLGYSGAEFAKPAPVEETYTTAPTGMLTDTPPDTCTGGSSAAASGESAFELIYFPVMAKGLQLAFIAEMSGLPWTGYTSEESGPKSWPEIKDSGVAPFGQMPLLKVTGGITLGQSTAIANYISKLAGPALRGESPTDFAKSQMCMAEGEDIYAALQNCMLQKWKTPEARKEGEEAAAAFFKDGLAKHLGNLEKLATANVNDEGKYSACKFTSTGMTAGELYLFGMLHQAVLAGGAPALGNMRPIRGGSALVYPKVKGWYDATLKEDAIQKVLSGDSAMGTFQQYFLDTPSFNEANGIEDDGYGQANGYGTVAVDLAAEAAKQKEIMKALRASQMDKPPPVAMKKNPITGEMEKFESAALQDDLPDEEVEEGEVFIPGGDDY